MFRELHKELKNLERKKRRAEMYEIEQEITILLFTIFFGYSHFVILVRSVVINKVKTL